MIKNDRQYYTTKKRLKEFQEALAQSTAAEMDGLTRELVEGGIKSQMESFEREINEYEKLKAGGLAFLQINSVIDLPDVLVKARIVSGWTQANLGEALELNEQQIQRYESGDYLKANLSKINEVYKVLKIEGFSATCTIGRYLGEAPEGFTGDELSQGFRKLQENGILRPIH